MSETPITDSEERWCTDIDEGNFSYVDPDFARTLERENAQLRKEREELIAMLFEVAPSINGLEDYSVIHGIREDPSRVLAPKLRALLAKLEGGK